MSYQKTIDQVCELIKDMKVSYEGRLCRYQSETVKNWQHGQGPLPLPGFCVSGWFHDGGHILLEWPVVDLDAALAFLLLWRKREGLETIAGAGALQSTSIGFGGFVLDVDDHGKIAISEDEIAIRQVISSGLFPQWSISCDGQVSIETRVQ
ncbi:hypothetical protein PVL97_06835 [Aeromonas hydrophila]|uniref:hypothetical protein n=1 Tax=Aeromonas hydrophila TaxID=644 RepID=UPI0023785A1C|nr:hypothetical protein [Aeromonas hydrophila]MDD9229363.1 hypothetical protein [Aeromonas hydrophila]